MERIVESVPNFSTADPAVIKAITSEIKSVKGVKLLNVEPDVDYNRVVVTFVGTPTSVGDAAFKAIAKAGELIDMTAHKGEHPRMGATDVCPFIPVKNVTVEECVDIANEVAKKVAEQAGIPTYLYGKAAKNEQRLKLSDIRKGEYEGFEEKIKLPEWKPDYGEPVFNKKSGATTIGVRGFLIAYNVNIEAEDVDIAREVGGLVRESGRLVEKDGEKVRVPGLLKGIQGMGVTLEKFGRKLTQVSMNVVDFQNLTPMHQAFEEVKRLTEELGSKVTGSEVVGLIPLEAILEAGKFYAPDEQDQNTLIQIAIKQLGLSDLEPFDPKKKIIELMIEDEKLVDLTVDRFVEELASDSPAPGGGSVSALGAALAGGLATMVSNLTIGKKKYEAVEEEMIAIHAKAQEIYEQLIDKVDEDTEAFNQVMAAFGTPKDNPERSSMIQSAMVYAATVPMEVSDLAFTLFDILAALAERGNSNAITDVGVGALFADAAIRGALYNVRINLMSIKDEAIKKDLENRINAIMTELDDKKQKVLDVVEKELS
ncbi:MAG: glutamate formimidoyltransferase [Candidatus Heimdallarchaeota archaeon]|nr:glutamate formimidoyltransferase [Candidatus Heimdallarchaeota archaeon]